MAVKMGEAQAPTDRGRASVWRRRRWGRRTRLLAAQWNHASVQLLCLLAPASKSHRLASPCVDSGHSPSPLRNQPVMVFGTVSAAAGTGFLRPGAGAGVPAAAGRYELKGEWAVIATFGPRDRYRASWRSRR